MSVQVNVDLSGLNNMLSGRSLERATQVLADQAEADMDKFVPYKQGHLSKNVAIGLDGKTIIYTVPYAKAQFYGFVTNYKTGKQLRIRNYTKTTHSQASRRWDLRAKSLYGDEWANKVKKSLLEGK